MNGREIHRETPAEIIGKKIVFRGASLQPRDMFDIAAVSAALGEDVLVQTLLPLAEACQPALTVAQRMNPDLAQSVMGKLMVRPEYAGLLESAQSITRGILERVVAEAPAR